MDDSCRMFNIAVKANDGSLAIGNGRKLQSLERLPHKKAAHLLAEVNQLPEVVMSGARKRI